MSGMPTRRRALRGDRHLGPLPGARARLVAAAVACGAGGLAACGVPTDGTARVLPSSEVRAERTVPAAALEEALTDQPERGSEESGTVGLWWVRDAAWRPPGGRSANSSGSPGG